MTRLLVVGGDAAGMSAAHQAMRTAKKRGSDLDVTVLEQTTHTSYSACGIPYWVGDEVADADDLVARTPEEHRRSGLDLRTRHRVEHLDLASRTATAVDLEQGREVRIGFDQVMIATGAEPRRPDWAHGEDVPDGVFVVRNLDDGAALRERLERGPRSAVVVGGGYVGVEVAEALARRGLRTTLVTQGQHLMSAGVVPQLAELVVGGLEKEGVEVVLGHEVSAVEGGASGVRVACVDGAEHEAEVVVIGIGVQPRTRLAVQAGIAVGGPDLQGALVPDDRQSLGDGVWTAGDCAAVRDAVTGVPRYVPLGTHANKAGRVAGTNIGGGDVHFAGMVGTSITRVGDLEVSRTGLMPGDADALGLRTEQVLMESTTTSGYMPGSEQMTMWALGERGSGRLLGLQIVGGRGAGKRIDVAATAVMLGLAASAVANLDLAYAPPFSPVWDPVQIVCRKLADRL